MRELVAGSRSREGVPHGMVGLRTTLTIGDPVMDGNTNPYTEPKNLDSFPGTVTGISLHCQEGYTVRLSANRGARRQEGYPFLRAGTPGRWRERFLNWGIESFVYELLEGTRDPRFEGDPREEQCREAWRSRVQQFRDWERELHAHAALLYQQEAREQYLPGRIDRHLPAARLVARST